jgi:hypothetical protein
MPSAKATKPPHVVLKEQAAKVLIAAMYEFLSRNKIPEEIIKGYKGPDHKKNIRNYRRLMRIWEYTGVLMGTWYSNPKFLDRFGNPVPLPPKSISRLIRASHVAISAKEALELMRSSPSVKTNSDGDLIPLRKVLVLPDSEVPRAALVVERFLDTLYRNASLRKYNATLLERSCRASGVDLSGSAPILRDIKEQGGAFMDAVDGEIEARRARGPKRNGVKLGELGVVVFAWVRPNLLTQKVLPANSRSKHRAPDGARATTKSNSRKDARTESASATNLPDIR